VGDIRPDLFVHGGDQLIRVSRIATMPFARGERKPCTYSGCDGTMRFSQYSRRRRLEVDGSTSNVLPIGKTPGWVCDTDATHVEAVSIDAGWRV
jgi:hypothetical protein